jgi:hypothetical protein
MGVNKAGDSPKIPNQAAFTERRAESATNLTNTFVRDRSLEQTSKQLGLLKNPKDRRWDGLFQKVWRGNTEVISPATKGAVFKTGLAAQRAFKDAELYAQSRKGHTLPPSKKPREI